MLDKFQTSQSIEQQVTEGFKYFILNYNNKPVGYLAIKQETDALFLSKIYVLIGYREKKIGKTALLFVEKKAKKYNLTRLRLSVNKYNTNAVNTYKKFGFKNIGAFVQDIENGFIMDDYEMVKAI